MKRTILTITICAFITGTLLTSCNTSPSERVEDAQKNVIRANNDLEQANKEYQADIANYRIETAQKIEDNNQTIIGLKEKMEHQKKAVKADYKKKIAALEEKNSEMKQKMDNYKEEGKEKWLVFKAEFSHDMDELGKALKDITVKNVK